MFSRRRGGGRHARPGRTPAADTEADEDAVPVPERGPYDVTLAPPGARLDLGSLQIPAVDGVDIRVQASPEGIIQQVILVHGESALQLGAFAAPRSEGIWDDVREEIRRSFSADGVASKETDGEYGVELRARVPAEGGVTDLRFVGIDGPRWMVRAVYQGRAASDPAAAGPLTDCLRGLVVDRGQEAKPVREPLPLRLPPEIAERAQPSEPEQTI